MESLKMVLEAAINATEAVRNIEVGLGAGLAALGTIGTALGQGFACGKAVEAVARNPEADNKIRTMLIVGDAICETSAIYALIIAILLIFVAK